MAASSSSPVESVVEPVPAWAADRIAWFQCPACAAPMRAETDRLRCHTGHDFAAPDGLVDLYWPTQGSSRSADVSQTVREFYEANPFPNYEQADSLARLQQRAEAGVFARLLDEQIPPNARILDVGCGTGQLSNFLGLAPGRRVIGADLSSRSLQLGAAFAARHELRNVGFCRMNLFQPAFQPETFDVVICNGVLHHTGDPLGGFLRISRLVRQGGFILIGLYNAIGRWPTHLRRVVLRFAGERILRLDDRLRRGPLEAGKRRSWIMDQYRHPRESCHTFGEALAWFQAAGFQFITSVPKSRVGDAFAADEPLFVPQPMGGVIDRALVQLSMLWSGGRDGALFVMIGRRAPLREV